MLRRTTMSAMFRASALLRSGGGNGPLNTGVASHGLTNVHPLHDKSEYPTLPHDLMNHGEVPDVHRKSMFFWKLYDQSIPMYDDALTGTARVMWQEPARTWHMFEADDTLVLQEHDREEWNDKPYVAVNHLYEPPLGSEERPIRVEVNGNPGDTQIVLCFGNCAPHVPQTNFYMTFKGYTKNQCPMCQQWFYVHNRPWLVMHPDWTDEPAPDEGPAFTFAEIESEFDRDFHEFSVFLNVE